MRHSPVTKALHERQMRKQAKVEKTMHEYKHGELHSGSKTGPLVTSHAQAVAIALNQARRIGKR